MKTWFRPLLLVSVLIVSFTARGEPEPAPHVFLAGDSTMCDYNQQDTPVRGWGMELPAFFVDPAMIRNHARSGRSTRSFIAEGRWQKVQEELKAGDFVIIQFSHNDEKVTIATAGTDPATTFRDNLRRFIRETREKHANPILATPVARRRFNAAGKLVPSHGAYPDAIRSVAVEEKVPLLELEHATEKWLQETGPEASKKFFVWLEPGVHPKFPQGSKDDTHFVDAGATRVAELAVAQIREQRLPLAKWLK